jgi:hypothetical protein
MTSWIELQREFRMAVLRRGNHTVQEIADEIPASRRTVYYLMGESIHKPSKALHANIERFVKQRACKVAQPGPTDSQD